MDRSEVRLANLFPSPWDAPAPPYGRLPVELPVSFRASREPRRFRPQGPIPFGPSAFRAGRFFRGAPESVRFDYRNLSIVDKSPAVSPIVRRSPTRIAIPRDTLWA